MRFGAYITTFVLLFAAASSSIAQHLTSAKLYLQQRQYEKAEASAMKAVEKDPDDEEGWFVLGRARYELKKYPQMVEAFQKAATLDPEEHESEIGQYRLKVWADSYNDGIRFYNLGRDTASYFQGAIDAFETAIVARPESLQTYYVCALAYYGNNQIEKAMQTLNVGLQRDGKASKELELLGKLHLQLAREKESAGDGEGAKQEYTDALSTFERLFKLDPSNVDNMIRLMEVYEQLGMSEKALAMTRDAIAVDPTNAYLHFAQGVFLLKQDKYEESVNELKQAVDLIPDETDPLFEDATYNLGVAYLNWGVSIKAEADEKADQAAKTGKGTKESKEDLSYKEKFKTALPYLEKTVTKKGDDVNLWQQLGRLYANLNMVDKMKRAFSVVDSLTSKK